MRRTLNECIKILKRERKWLVSKKGKSITMARTINNRPVFISLEKEGYGNRFQLSFPSYIFHSHNAHYGPATDEVRMCRNKALLKSAIKALKRSAVWGMINNQGFLVVNSDNVTSDKKKLKAELRELYGWDPDAPRKVTKKAKKKTVKKKKS